MVDCGAASKSNDRLVSRTSRPQFAGVNPADFQQTEKRLREEVAAAVFQRIDRMTDAVGRVMYPPLYVAAFPLWALCGGGAIGRGFGK